MQLDFFNTIHLAGPELVSAKKQTGLQDERVLEIIRKGVKMTPFQVSSEYDKLYNPAPVTSIRRSMTVLTDRGKLEMCDEMVTEKYGKPNHYWKIVEHLVK